MSQIKINRKSIFYITFIAMSTAYIIYLRHVYKMELGKLNDNINNLNFQLNTVKGYYL